MSDRKTADPTAAIWGPPEPENGNGAHDPIDLQAYGIDPAQQTDPCDEPNLIPLGGIDPKTGKRVLSTKITKPTAIAFVHQFHLHDEGRTIHTHADRVLGWLDNRYVEIEPGSLNHRLLNFLHDSLRYIPVKGGDPKLVQFEANPSTVESAAKTIKAYTNLPSTITPTAWLDGRTDPDPKELLPTPSGNLHIPTMKLLLPSPKLFNTNAIDFEFDPKAPTPLDWLKFLDMLWAKDIQSIECLQEWFGYCLVADTSQQKMLLLVGPKRSGKGTIARILSRLVGQGNVVGPTTNSLAGPFGLQPLIGKSLAIVSDARFTGDAVAVIIERLLCISGEDRLTIDQKFMTSVSMTLPTRMMFLSNELPRMNDASGALAGRWLVLRLVQSFYGREDVALTNKLMQELPGILNWSVEGLKRLRKRGHFVQPASVGDAIRELEDLASPCGAFVREFCEVGAGKNVPVAEIFEAWSIWGKQQGRDHAGDQQRFGRDLRAAVAGITCRQSKDNGDRFRVYEGIGLTSAAKTEILAFKMAESQKKGGWNGSPR